MTDSHLKTILFTDIVSFTEITQRIGDKEAQKLLKFHNKIVRDALKIYGGKEIKHTGDGIMAYFTSASNSINCAGYIQKRLNKEKINDFYEDRILLSIGINAGEPIVENEDLFGTSVQIAARVCEYAGKGEVLITDVVKQLVDGKKFSLEDKGQVELDGLDEPINLHKLNWKEKILI